MRQKIPNIRENIENNTLLYFYITETAELLEKYKKILNIPLKISFLNMPIIDT
jgi:hypothetical protein